MSAPADRTTIGFVPEAEVGQRARRGAVWSIGQIILRHGISIGTTAVLARILAPGDYGLTGMVATLTAVLQVFADLGLSQATIQRKDLNRAQVNNLFWLNIGVGFCLWLICILLAPAVAGFYRQDELVQITMIAGLGFVISGFAVQPMALLNRAMDFRKITLIEISALACGATAGLTSALAGAGYWALVAQGLVTASVRMLLALVFSRWRFAAPVRNTGTMALVGFGGTLAINGLLIYLARNLDGVLIGRVWGPEALGIYNRAYFLMLLPSMLAAGALSGLMVPSLSALQHDRDRFAAAYRRALRLVAWAGTPMAVGLGLTAGPAVTLVYGPGWGEVVTVLAWLSLAAVSQPIYNTNGWLFTASGRAGAYLVLTVLNTLLLALVFLLTVQDGIVALARGYGIAMGLVIPLPALWYAHRTAQIPFAPSLRALAPVIVLNLVMAFAVWTSGFVLRSHGVTEMTIFTIQVVLGIATYLALTPVLAHKMSHEDLSAFIRRRTE